MEKELWPRKASNPKSERKTAVRRRKTAMMMGTVAGEPKKRGGAGKCGCEDGATRDLAG